MLDVIVNYWVLWALGLITGGISWLTHRWIKLENKAYKEERQAEEHKTKEEIIKKLEDEIKVEVQKSNAADVEIRANMEVLENDIDNLTVGILAIQGKEFRQECHELLNPAHIITIDEYEQCAEDYVAYHALGGNHKGDTLFNSVEKKWTAQLTKEQ